MPRVSQFSLIIALSVFAIGWHAAPAQARGFRVSLTPNGSENSCVNCHVNPGGGGTRNEFGEDVRSLVTSGGREEFWTLTLADEDSDDDGFTNGQELGDIDGDGVPERTVNISLPGDATSAPAAAPGDCNLDTELTSHDLSCVSTIEDRDVVLASLNSIAGDFDGDGSVGFPDFLILSTNFGQDLPAYTDGNIDLSGPVDFSDFLVLSTNFGMSGAGALSPVPEPNGGLLCLIGLMPFLGYRRSRVRPKLGVSTT